MEQHSLEACVKCTHCDRPPTRRQSMVPRWRGVDLGQPLCIGCSTRLRADLNSRTVPLQTEGVSTSTDVVVARGQAQTRGAGEVCFYGHTITHGTTKSGAPKWRRMPEGCTWRDIPPGSTLCDSCYSAALKSRGGSSRASTATLPAPKRSRAPGRPPEQLMLT